MSDSLVHLPAGAPDGFSMGLTIPDMLSGLRNWADEAAKRMYVCTDQLVHLGVLYIILPILKKFSSLCKQVLIVPAQAAQHLRDGRFQDFWSVGLGINRKADFKSLQSARYLFILYGGTDLGWHYSAFVVVNPWSDDNNKQPRSIIHMDSLAAGHNTQGVGGRVVEAINFARTKLGLSQVDISCSRANMPIQPNESNSCGLAVINNCGMLLHKIGNGMVPDWKGCMLRYAPIQILATRQLVLNGIATTAEAYPELQPVIDEIKANCPLLDSNTAFVMPEDYTETVQREQDRVAELYMPADFSKRATRASSASQGARSSQGDYTASVDDTVASDDDDDENMTAPPEGGAGSVQKPKGKRSRATAVKKPISKTGTAPRGIPDALKESLAAALEAYGPISGDGDSGAVVRVVTLLADAAVFIGASVLELVPQAGVGCSIWQQTGCDIGKEVQLALAVLCHSSAAAGSAAGQNWLPCRARPCHRMVTNELPLLNMQQLP